MKRSSYFLINRSGKRQKLKLEDRPLRVQDEAAVYAVAGRNLAARIYFKSSVAANYLDKVQAMLDNAPDPAAHTQDETSVYLAWPLSLVVDEDSRFIGYLMHYPVFSACTLEQLFQRESREKHRLPENYRYRIRLAYNLAALVAALHERGHYIADLHPAAVSIDRESAAVAMLDCDHFSIQAPNGRRYTAQRLPQAYTCPEAIRQNWAPVEVDESQDRFALAVIIFQLLNDGIHPYQGVKAGRKKLPATLHQAVEQELYAYGRVANERIKPLPYSMHAHFDTETRDLFDQAFAPQQGARPGALAWCAHLSVYLGQSADGSASGRRLKPCEFDDDHCYFTDACGLCYLEAKKPRADGIAVGEHSPSYDFPRPAPGRSGMDSRWRKVRLKIRQRLRRRLQAIRDHVTRVSSRARLLLLLSYAAIFAFAVVAVVILYLTWGSSKLSAIKLKGDVKAVTPSAMRTGVSPNVTLKIEFKQDIDMQRSVAPLIRVDDGVSEIAGKVRVKANTLFFKPLKPLTPGVEYQVRLGQLIGRQSGERLHMAKRWYFYTRPKLLDVDVRRIQRIDYAKSHARFGQSIALSSDGGSLAVGAPEDSERRNITGGSGSVTVFRYSVDDKKWVAAEKFQPYVKNKKFDHLDEYYKYRSYPLPYMKIEYGAELVFASAAQVLAVGAPVLKNKAGHVGSVFIYQRRQDQWVQSTEFKNTHAANTLFGTALQLSADGRTLAIASARRTPGELLADGAIYLYQRKEKGGWFLRQVIRNLQFRNFTRTSTHRPIQFALSADAQLLAVAEQNRVSFYRRQKDKWVRAEEIAPQGLRTGVFFGNALRFADQGRLLVVGATRVPNRASPETFVEPRRTQGTVYVYRHTDDGTWKLLQKLVPSQGYSVSNFGHVLDATDDGKTIVVGAIEADKKKNRYGVFYLFQRVAGRWQPAPRQVLSRTVGPFQVTNTITLKLHRKAPDLVHVFGAVAEDSNPALSLLSSGAVHIFEAEIPH